MKKFRLPAALTDKALTDHFTPAEIRGIELFYDYIISRDINKRDITEFAYDYVQVGRNTLRAFFGKKNYNSVLNRLLALRYLERLGCDENGWTGKDNKYQRQGFYRQPKEENDPAVEADDAQQEDESLAPRCKSFRVPVALKGGEYSYRVIERAITKVEANKMEAAKADRAQHQEKYRNIIRRNMENLALVNTPESRAAIVKHYSYDGVQVNPEEFIDLFNTTNFYETGVDAFGHRVDAPLTRTNKALRPFIRFAHEMDAPLVEIDFVASQPSLLACITPKLIAKLAPECRAAAPLFKAIEQDLEWESYRALCLTTMAGEGIYDKLAQYYTAMWGVPMTRDDGKGIYYRACFSNYAWFAKHSLAQIEATHKYMMKHGNERARVRTAAKVFTKRCILMFERHFKRVYDLFWELKHLGWDVEGQTAPHANNCLLAQRIESALMYTVLVKAVRAAGVLDVVTIHDALFIKANDEPKVRRVVQQELDKLKLNLKLKTK